MAKINSLSKFLVECKAEKPEYYNDFKRIVEHNVKKEEKKLYAIEISFDPGDDSLLLLEHTKLKQFQKTRNRYLYDPGDPQIPVRAHYHIFPPKSDNKELYAVNMDGTAHHKRNRGLEIPRKEADELRGLGVQIPVNNIIEMLELPTENETEKLLLESVQKQTTSIFLTFEE